MAVDDRRLYASIDALANATEHSDALVREELLKAVPTYRPPSIEQEIDKEKQLAVGA